MKTFMNEEFLLETTTAQRLYHEYAEHMPIIDYHCHISPQEIYTDLRYDNLAQPFLGGDHYKWRLMRACGVPERLITGDAEPYEKFLALAETLPRAVGNPVYHWTNLELKRYFGCDAPLSLENASEIWEHCNKLLRETLSVREIVKCSNVFGIATTDDPMDDLKWHEKLAADESFNVTVRPAWRPDKLVNIESQTFKPYMEKMGSPNTLDELKAAICSKMDFFALHGCSSSDHGIASLVQVEASDQELNDIYKKGIDGAVLTEREINAYQYSMLLFLAREYARRDWVMEIHYGAARNNNTYWYDRMGADTGFDSIAPWINVSGLTHFLDALYLEGNLPKTILFSLNPNDNVMLNTLAGCYQREGTRSVVQQGVAWWFNDSKLGMESQMLAMANNQPLGNFIGMVTDSRSFLSYTRHEYFRRVLCNLLGGLAERGEYPNDLEYLGGIVRDVSYNNTRDFFGYKNK